MRFIHIHNKWKWIDSSSSLLPGRIEAEEDEQTFDCRARSIIAPDSTIKLQPK